MELDKFNEKQMSAAVQASRIQELAAQGYMPPQEVRAGVAPRCVNQDEDEFDQFDGRAAFNGDIPSLSPKEFDISSMVSDYESAMRNLHSEICEEVFSNMQIEVDKEDE